MKPTFLDLPNGSRLAVASNPHLNSVAVMAGVRVGSRHEPDGLHGAAHFVEHMIFKGTERRPTAKDVTTEVEARGGSMNAFTDKEMTAFHVMMSKHDADLGVDVIQDMMANAAFRTEDVERERPVIREEISMYDNDPNSNVWDLSEERAFAGSGLAHRITGSIEDVGFTPDALRAFFKANYDPARTLFVLAGSVSDKLAGWAAELFGGIPAAGTPARSASPAPGHPRGRDFIAAKTDRLHVVVRFPGVRGRGREALALELLGEALGGYSSARLYQTLRESEGLCYGVGSSLYGYSDTASVVVSTSLDRPKFARAMRAILREVDSIRESGFRPEEIENAKTRERGALLMELDRPMSMANDIVRQDFVHGSYEDPESRLERMMSVTLRDVQDAAVAHMGPDGVHVSVAGPAEAEAEVLSILDGLL